MKRALQRRAPRGCGAAFEWVSVEEWRAGFKTREGMGSKGTAVEELGPTCGVRHSLPGFLSDRNVWRASEPEGTGKSLELFVTFCHFCWNGHFHNKREKWKDFFIQVPLSWHLTRTWGIVLTQGGQVLKVIPLDLNWKREAVFKTQKKPSDYFWPVRRPQLSVALPVTKLEKFSK